MNSIRMIDCVPSTEKVASDLDDLTDVVPPRPPTPPEVRKPKTERPKTVKEFGSKLRLSSFLEEDGAPPVKKKLTKTGVAVVPKSPATAPGAARPRNLSGPSGVRASLMNAHMNQAEQQVGNIKLIAPKAAHLIIENEGFMNALNASNHADSQKAAAAKKKKKLTAGPEKRLDGARRESSKEESADETADGDCREGEIKTESCESEGKLLDEHSTSAAPKLSFYKDTLEEGTDDPNKPLRRSMRNRTKKAVVDENSDDDDAEKNRSDDEGVEGEFWRRFNEGNSYYCSPV